MAPPATAVVPIGEELLIEGLKRRFTTAEFYVVDDAPAERLPRQPVRGRGRPRVRRRPAARRAGRDHALREPRAAAVPAEGVRDQRERLPTRTGAATSCSSRRAACRSRPLAIAVHLASVWVPFTSEAKEAVAHYDELLQEMKLALQECGRKLGAHLRARAHIERDAKQAQPLRAVHPRGGAGDLGDILGVATRTRSRSRSTTRSRTSCTSPTRPTSGRRAAADGAATARAAAERRTAAPTRRQGAARRERAEGEGPNARRRRRRQGRRQGKKRGEQLSLPMLSEDRHGSQEDRSAAREDAKTRAIDANTLVKIEKLARGRARRGEQGRRTRRSRSARATLSNVSFNEKKKIIELGDQTQSREFFNTAMARKFMQTLLVASGCKTLIDEGKTVSIRQMYLHDEAHLQGSSENTFEDQNESDPIIEDLEVGIDALREELHLFADAQGSSSASSSSTTRATASTSRAWAAAAGASRASASPT